MKRTSTRIARAHVTAAPAGSLIVAIDSIDTMCSDLASPSKCYAVISSLLALLRAKSGEFELFPCSSWTNTTEASSRLIIHANSPTPVLPLLLSTRLSPSLIHIIAHPPVLLKHIAETHLIIPPPKTPPERFWRVFSPIATRAWEVEHLVYDIGGLGSGGGWDEAVLEVVVRAQVAIAEGKRRGTERVLEGWSQALGPCDLTELEGLRTIWTKSSTDDVCASRCRTCVRL